MADDSGVERLLSSLKEKYSHSVRPRTASEFSKANQEWRSNAGAIKSYLSSRGLGSPAKYLVDSELISKVVTEGSLPRPSNGVLGEFLERVSGSVDDLRRISPSARVVRMESVVEAAEWSDCRLGFEMLRTGDFLELVEDVDDLVRAEFCGFDLGCIGYGGRTSGSLAERVRHPREWGLVGGRVFARVTGIKGSAKKASAGLELFYAEDPEASTIVDGMILSPDGKRLLGCTGLYDADVVVPEGIEVICEGAFRGHCIASVVLPLSLRVIGREAFAMTGLRSVTIPSSVAEIGACAFTHGFPYQGFTCFDDGPVRIDVEEDNERYYSVDGCLIERCDGGPRLLSAYYARPKNEQLSATHPDGALYSEPLRPCGHPSIPVGIKVLGRSFISCYDGADIGLTVPEGVSRLEAGCLDRLACTRPQYGGSRLTAASIPSSVVEVSDDCWQVLCGGCRRSGETIESGLSYDSTSCELTISEGNPKYRIADGKVVAKAL
ncbi:MAG: leucine-rich repeat protein [Olsenella sp.]|nr:leucine-rich repeat protein [Olsenella sp.]